MGSSHSCGLTLSRRCAVLLDLALRFLGLYRSDSIFIGVMIVAYKIGRHVLRIPVIPFCLEHSVGIVGPADMG